MHLKLSPVQRAAYNEFQEARVKSLNDAKDKLCDKEPDLSSFEKRMIFCQSFLQAKLDATKAENPKLIAFHNSLNAEQKRKFDSFRAQMANE